MTRDELSESVRAKAGGVSRENWMMLLLQDVFDSLDKLKPYGIHLDVHEATPPEPIEYPKHVKDPNTGIVFEVMNKDEEDAVLAGAPVPAAEPDPVPDGDPPPAEYPKHIPVNGKVYEVADVEAEDKLLGGDLSAGTLYEDPPPAIQPQPVKE